MSGQDFDHELVIIIIPFFFFEMLLDTMSNSTAMTMAFPSESGKMFWPQLQQSNQSFALRLQNGWPFIPMLGFLIFCLFGCWLAAHYIRHMYQTFHRYSPYKTNVRDIFIPKFNKNGSCETEAKPNQRKRSMKHSLSSIVITDCDQISVNSELEQQFSVLVSANNLKTLFQQNTHHKPPPWFRCNNYHSFDFPTREPSEQSLSIPTFIVHQQSPGESFGDFTCGVAPLASVESGLCLANTRSDLLDQSSLLNIQHNSNMVHSNSNASSFGEPLSNQSSKATLRTVFKHRITSGTDSRNDSTSAYWSTSDFESGGILSPTGEPSNVVIFHDPISEQNSLENKTESGGGGSKNISDNNLDMIFMNARSFEFVRSHSDSHPRTSDDSPRESGLCELPNQATYDRFTQRRHIGLCRQQTAASVEWLSTSPKRLSLHDDSERMVKSWQSPLAISPKLEMGPRRRSSTQLTPNYNDFGSDPYSSKHPITRQQTLLNGPPVDYTDWMQKNGNKSTQRIDPTGSRRRRHDKLQRSGSTRPRVQLMMGLMTKKIDNYIS